MSSSKVTCVYNDLGGFYDVYPKISRSLQNMRDKILGIKNVKWEWHVVLTVSPKALRRIKKAGGFSGAVLNRFLTRTRTIYKSNRKYFWKYEEGGIGGRPHYHMLFEFKKKFNMGYVLNKLYPYGWRRGGVHVKRLMSRARKNPMNRDKTDTEILMGILLNKKWNNGITFARQIKGLGRMYKKNVIYYINKDLLKPTGLQYIKSGSDKWHFGTGYKFEPVSLFSEKKLVSINECIYKMMTTKQSFIDYYDSIDKNGYKFFFKRIRQMKKGEYFKNIQ